ncbi:hypothetical protein CRE_06270 [Caenorhabditis remanei]|uniref:Tyrosine-protein phosphatase domain-containing protein n=1 Tax=Caenorhabditis remanei TaxID=31234 RepID=E3NVQ6_CAERE|nr:hypothetical protein CRE_06270 [Caenorhabditis remanei]
MSINGSNLNGLADGLQPLFKVQQRMGGLYDKLKLLASSNVRDSLDFFKQFQESLGSVEQSSADLVSNLFVELKKCDDNHTAVSEKKYETTAKIIGTAKKLAALSASVNSAVDGLNPTELTNKVNSLFISVGFSNFAVQQQSVKEIQSVLKNKDGLNEILKFLNQLKEKFNVAYTDSLKGEIEHMVNNHPNFEFTGYTNELKVHDCALKHAQNSAKVSQAIKAVQNLRGLDPKKIETVETAVTVVSEVAKGLSDVTSIPGAMKKSAKEVTTELNKLPDSLKNSEAIGQSVTSLYTASQLRGLESQISQLKTIDADVQAEIQKMLSPDDRKKVESQWGVHKKDMDELEKILAEIKTFDTGIDVSKAKTLGAYGTPLKQLASLSSSNIKAKEKSKALEVLLSQQSQPPIDPSTKSRNEFPNHTLTHYQYITWPDRGVPTDHETGIALMDLVKKSKKPVVVHCSAGIGRTMSFIGIEYIYDEVLANPGIVWCDAMIKMRDARWHGIQTYVQSIWVLLAVFFKLIRKYKLKSKPYTEDLKIMKEINDDPAAAAAPAAAPAEAPEAAEAPAAPAAAPRAPAAGENAEGIHEEDENQGQPRNHVIIPIE